MTIQAYERNIKLPKYLLLTIGWYRGVWWKVQDDNLNCTAEQRESVLFSSLAFLNFKFLEEEDYNITTSFGTVSMFGSFGRKKNC